MEMEHGAIILKIYLHIYKVGQTITFEQKFQKKYFQHYYNHKQNKMAVFTLGCLKVWDFYARTAFRRPPLDHPLWRKGPRGPPLSSYPSNLLRFFLYITREGGWDKTT